MSAGLPLKRRREEEELEQPEDQEQNFEMRPEPPALEEEQEVFSEPQLSAQTGTRDVETQTAVMEEQQQDVKQEPDAIPVSCSHFGQQIHQITNQPTHEASEPTVQADQLSECSSSSNASEYEGAMKSHDRVLRPKVQCSHPGCGKVFSCKSRLARHMSVHTEERPYQCQTCGKLFKREDSLNIHTAFHARGESYICKTCKKKFTTIVSLRRHNRIHTGEEPYPCGTCGRRFSRKDHRDSHVRSHTEEKQFICDICEMCFPTKFRLKIHLRGDHIKTHNSTQTSLTYR